MEGLIFFVIAWILSYILTPKTLDMLKRGGLMKHNYLGVLIPNGAGIVFPAVLALTYAFLAAFSYLTQDAYIYLGLISLVSFAGFVDDVAGNRERRGFLGHFSYLVQQKEFTTGIWKAGIGGIAAFLAAALYSFSWWNIMINTLLVALTINIFNLFDVCPGRSIKVFFLASLGIIVFIPSYTAHILIYPVAGILAAFAVYDLKGQTMMGDTGSNLIGLAVGLAVMAGGNILTRMVMVIFLILLHLAAERYSFSQVINNNRILLSLDRLGRRD